MQRLNTGNSVLYSIIFGALFFVLPCSVFSQQGASSTGLRDYVGLINQSYHPGIVSYFEKTKEKLTKQGETNAVKSIDIFLSGAFGSGFLYSDAAGKQYVITNNHVVAQAYTLAITFERQDGFKMKVENLKIIAADEEVDLAILALPAGERLPAARGLTLLTRQINEGEDVFSAGFPGLGMTPIWQFGRGMVSNAFVRFPKSFDDETLMGPYIQHTAQIDGGNSGGPLLVAQQGAPSGYAVAGINTLSATRRQAANYAIPVNTALTFINNALNPKPATYRDDLDTRLNAFAKGLGVNRAVYPHIAEYLSTECIGENAEYAIEELFEKASTSVKRAFLNKIEDGVIGAMGYAVAWTIENSIRSGGAINASIKEVTGEGEEYTVIFTMNNNDVESLWVREHGNWRLRSFGIIAAGKSDVLEKKKKAEKKAAADLHLDSSVHLELGYASLFDKAPGAVYASLELLKYVGFKLYVAGPDFVSFGGFVGYRWDVPVGKNFGIMPYLRAGFDYQKDEAYEDFKKKGDRYGEPDGFPISIMAQAGIKATSSYVPGLFLGTGFQYNLFGMHNKSYEDGMKMGVIVTAGYAF